MSEKFKIKFNEDKTISVGSKKITYEKGKVYEVDNKASRDRWVRRGCEDVSKSKEKPEVPASGKEGEKRTEKSDKKPETRKPETKKPEDKKPEAK